MSNYSLYIITFIVTGVWDIVLRYMSEHYSSLPKIVKQQFPFIKYLIPYFKAHTVLAAALIAGFIGATTQMIISQIMTYPGVPSSFLTIVAFLTISFIVSALYGFLIKPSGLFPVLLKTYYRNLDNSSLGAVRSMYHDGISGVIVQCTLLALSYISHKLNIRLV